LSTLLTGVHSYTPLPGLACEVHVPELYTPAPSATLTHLPASGSVFAIAGLAATAPVASAANRHAPAILMPFISSPLPPGLDTRRPAGRSHCPIRTIYALPSRRHARATRCGIAQAMLTERPCQVKRKWGLQATMTAIPQ
jgi:hypothetical protein